MKKKYNIINVERVSIADAVSVTGMKRRTLQHLAAGGRIPGAAKPAGRWTFDLLLLRNWAQTKNMEILKWQKTYTRGTASTGRALLCVDKHTDAAYRLVLNKKRSAA